MGNGESKKHRIAILISGRGSNMNALLRAVRGEIPDIRIENAEIGLVLSNIADAPGLLIAKQYGVATEILSHKDFKDRLSFDNAVTAILHKYKIDIVCLAGFMRLLSAEFVDTWHNRLINIHPSLLPKFKGLDTHARALAAGEKAHGCTVHFVRAEMDAGPIILQESISVLPGDTELSLAERVLLAEHRCYPKAVKLLTDGKIQVTGDTILVKG